MIWSSFSVARRALPDEWPLAYAVAGLYLTVMAAYSVVSW